MNNRDKTMEKIVALCKGRGFIFAGSEIYGGLANTWDYGPLGVEFKNNVKKAWFKKFVQESPYNVGLDSAIIMNPETWVTSGHVGGFSDPLMDCKDCHARHRADKLIEEVGGKLKLKSHSTGKYLKETGNTRGLYDEGGDVTFTKGTTDGKVKIQAPAYLHANNSGGNYFVDHCSSDGCAQHQFVVEPVKVYALTINALDKVGASATWNGETKTLPATWLLLDGATAAEVIEYLEERFEKTEILLGTFSLKFMKKSGRISAASAFAGELMGLRPVILMKHGKTEVLLKARGDKLLIPGLVAKLRERIRVRKINVPLYSTVFLVISHISFDANKNSKFLRPTQGLV